MDKVCGVYEIRNKLNGKVYIGSSKDIYKRWKEHIRELNKKEHHSEHLQSAWNTYGESAFDFNILEICEPENRFDREQYYMDMTQCYKRQNGYNMKRKSYWKKCSEQTEKKISIAMTGKRKGEDSPLNVFSEEDAKNVISYLMNPTLPYSKVAELTQTNDSFVKNIRFGKNWKYLTKNIVFPERDYKNRPKRFSEEDINDICYRLLNGESNKDIATVYDVSYQTIHSIRTHQIYKEYTDGLEFPEVHKGGQNCGSTSLSNEQVINIYNDFLCGNSMKALSDKYNINYGVIRNIVNGHNWRSITNVENEISFGTKCEHNSRAKLTEDQVINLIRMYKNGASIEDIMSKYNFVTRCTIKSIIDNKSWKHIDRSTIF